MTTTKSNHDLIDDAIYIGDNGRAFCGRHAGMSARYTGRDISGQRIVLVTPQWCIRNGEDCSAIRCETCAAESRRATGGAS